MRDAVLVRGVGPDAAWAWWTDFREGAEDHRWAWWAHPSRSVEELPDGALRMRETARMGPLRFEEEATVWLEKPVLRFVAQGTFGRFRGSMRFEPAPAGTRIAVEWEQELVPWLRALGPLGRWGIRRFYAWDLRHHARDLEREAGP